MSAAWNPQAACSGLSRAGAESLAGTAPHTPIWLLVADPGPWGERAPATARGPLGAALAAATAGIPGVAVVLTRPVRTGSRDQASPDRTMPDLPTDGGAERTGRRRCWVAHCTPHSAWLATAHLTPEELITTLPSTIAAVTGGAVPAGWAPADPVTLVCVNARRDPCCGVLGRPTAQRLASGTGTVLEASHLGGHRFAPVVLDLPSGWMFGRCSPEQAPARMLHHARGRVSLPGRLQAAEIGALRAAGYPRPVACEVTEDDGVHVRTPDGRRWRVGVRAVDVPPVPASCGRAPVSGDGWEVTVRTAAEPGCAPLIEPRPAAPHR